MSHYALLFDPMVVEFRKHVALDLAFASKTSRLRYAVNAVRRECQDICWIVECLVLECRRTSVFASVRRTLCLARFAEDVIYLVALWIAPVADQTGAMIIYAPLPLRSERHWNIQMCEMLELPELRTRRRDVLRGRIVKWLKGELNAADCLASDLRAEANEMQEWLEHMLSLRNRCSSLHYG